MLDALLSTGENDTGDNRSVIALNREVFRVLKEGGKYLIFSGCSFVAQQIHFLSLQ
jgi:hypothetical protein